MILFLPLCLPLAYAYTGISIGLTIGARKLRSRPDSRPPTSLSSEFDLGELKRIKISIAFLKWPSIVPVCLQGGLSSSFFSRCTASGDRPLSRLGSGFLLISVTVATSSNSPRAEFQRPITATTTTAAAVATASYPRRESPATEKRE